MRVLFHTTIFTYPERSQTTFFPPLSHLTLELIDPCHFRENSVLKNVSLEKRRGEMAQPEGAPWERGVSELDTGTMTKEIYGGIDMEIGISKECLPWKEAFSRIWISGFSKSNREGGGLWFSLEWREERCHVCFSWTHNQIRLSDSLHRCRQLLRTDEFDTSSSNATDRRIRGTHKYRRIDNLVKSPASSTDRSKMNWTST